MVINNVLISKNYEHGPTTEEFPVPIHKPIFINFNHTPKLKNDKQQCGYIFEAEQPRRLFLSEQSVCKPIIRFKTFKPKQLLCKELLLTYCIKIVYKLIFVENLKLNIYIVSQRRVAQERSKVSPLLLLLLLLLLLIYLMPVVTYSNARVASGLGRKGVRSHSHAPHTRQLKNWCVVYRTPCYSLKKRV